MAPTSTKKLIKIFLPLFIGFFFVWYSYQKFSAEQILEIKNHFLKADYRYLALSVFFGLLSHLSRAYRWRFVLEPMGYKPKFYNSVMAIFIAYLMNIFIPRSGEVSRAMVMDKYNDIPFEKGIGTIIVERILDLLVLILLVCLALIIEFDNIKNYLSNKIDFIKLSKYLLVVFVIIVIAYFVFKKFASMTTSRLGKFILGFKEGLLSVFRMKKAFIYACHTIFIWLMYLSMFYAGVFTLEEASHISIGAAMTTFVVGGIAIAFTNGGFGSYPYLVAEALILFNVPYTAGTAFGWIIWTVQFLLFVVMGCLSFLLLPLVNRKSLKAPSDQ